MPETRGRLCFAPSRYGEGVIGGAETVQRELAVGLTARGWEVEVVTTCARDHYSWANDLPPGLTEIDGLPVRRFPAEPPIPERAILEQRILRGERVSVDEQYRWLNLGMRPPAIYHYLLDQQERFSGMVFTPYPTWLAVAGGQISPRRTVWWACLHDEPYVYLDVFKPMLSGAGGLLLQSQPEVELLHRVVRAPAGHELVGCPVPVPRSYDPDRFRQRFGITEPFLLYAGRREGAKGWDALLADFDQATRRLDLPFALVTIGAGPVQPPERLANRVIDLGFVDEEDRNDAFAAAEAYLQPSRFEAFSRTIMEAWLAGTPVVGNRGSEVVVWHCERSGAGLVYRDSYEFEQCLAFLAAEPVAAKELAEPGRAYVIDNYHPDLVIDRVDTALQKWLREPWRP